MTQNNDSLLVVGLVGSLRTGSYTREVVKIALQGAAEVGVKTQLIDLKAYDLPFCDGDHDQVARYPDAVRLQKEVAAAQGVILGTPDYHGSFSGVLKNALDLMGFDEFGGKVMGLVGVSGGALGTVNALNDLRKVGRSLHAWVTPQQAAVPQASKRFNANGVFDDSDYEELLKEVGRQVARFSYLISSREAREFMALWEQAMPNPGGENR